MAAGSGIRGVRLEGRGFAWLGRGLEGRGRAERGLAIGVGPVRCPDRGVGVVCFGGQGGACCG